jgi:hypothetical protein
MVKLWVFAWWVMHAYTKLMTAYTSFGGAAGLGHAALRQIYGLHDVSQWFQASQQSRRCLQSAALSQGGHRPAPAPSPGLEQGGFRPVKKVQKTSNIRPEPTPWSALATGLDQPWSCPGQGVTLTHAAKCNSNDHDSNDVPGHAGAFSN